MNTTKNKQNEDVLSSRMLPTYWKKQPSFFLRSAIEAAQDISGVVTAVRKGDPNHDATVILIFDIHAKRRGGEH